LLLLLLLLLELLPVHLLHSRVAANKLPGKILTIANCCSSVRSSLLLFSANSSAASQ
jgi:hypothetical protein